MKVEGWKGFLQALLIVVVFVVAMYSIDNLIDAYHKEPKLVTKETTLNWLESCNPQNYKYLKEDLAEFVEEELELDEPVEEVVFQVYAQDVFALFTVTVWYKSDGSWYESSIEEEDIKDKELRKALNDVVSS